MFFGSCADEGFKQLIEVLGYDACPATGDLRTTLVHATDRDNGGRVVSVYRTGKAFLTGHLTADPEELRGVKEGLRIESKLGVPLEMAGARRGMVMFASLKRDYFTEDDGRYAEALVGWIGILAHRAELAEAMRELRLHWLRHWAAREEHAEPLREIELDVARLEYGGFRVDVRVQSNGNIIVLADAARLRQCIDNLIANAIEHSPKGGTISVLIATEKRDEGDYARVQVIDEGPGVPPDLLPRIFDRLAPLRFPAS